MKKLFLLFLFVPLIGLGQVNEIPRAFSLEKYTPHAIEQDGPYCLSVAYSNIMTILYAKYHKIENINEINENRFAPHFIKYLLPETTEDLYNRVSTISGFIAHMGLPFQKDFNNIPKNSTDLVEIVKKGSHYRLGECDCFRHMTMTEYYNSDSYFAGKVMDNDGIQEEEEQDLFNTHVDDIIPFEYKVFQKLNHNEIKREIFNGNPCLLGIYQYRQQEFQSSYESLGYSRLIVDTTKKIGHAMVIIGYNDSIHGGSYRILNSWGNDWADNGKTWIKYKELDNVEKLIVSYNSNSFFDATLSERDIKISLSRFEIPYFSRQNKIIKIDNEYLQNHCELNMPSNFGVGLSVKHGLITDTILARKKLCQCYVDRINIINEDFNIDVRDFTDYTDVIIEHYLHMCGRRLINMKSSESDDFRF